MTLCDVICYAQLVSDSFSWISSSDSETRFWLVSQLDSDFGPIPTSSVSRHTRWKGILSPALVSGISSRVCASCGLTHDDEQSDGWLKMIHENYSLHPMLLQMASPDLPPQRYWPKVLHDDDAELPHDDDGDGELLLPVLHLLSQEETSWLVMSCNQCQQKIIWASELNWKTTDSIRDSNTCNLFLNPE